jgi:hypothetical protein
MRAAEHDHSAARQGDGHQGVRICGEPSGHDLARG